MYTNVIPRKTTTTSTTGRRPTITYTPDGPSAGGGKAAGKRPPPPFPPRSADGRRALPSHRVSTRRAGGAGGWSSVSPVMFCVPVDCAWRYNSRRCRCDTMCDTAVLKGPKYPREYIRCYVTRRSLVSSARQNTRSPCPDDVKLFKSYIVGGRISQDHCPNPTVDRRFFSLWYYYQSKITRERRLIGGVFIQVHVKSLFEFKNRWNVYGAYFRLFDLLGNNWK